MYFYINSKLYREGQNLNEKTATLQCYEKEIEFTYAVFTFKNTHHYGGCFFTL